MTALYAAPMENEKLFAVEDQPLVRGLDYLRWLTAHHDGVITFQTGAGRLVEDLPQWLPAEPRYVEQRDAVARLVAETVYPLASHLGAQAVSLRIVAAPHAIAPQPAQHLETYIAFDTVAEKIHTCFLARDHVVPVAEAGVRAGLSVTCEPLNYRYHWVNDGLPDAPFTGASNMPNRADRNRDPAHPDEEWPHRIHVVPSQLRDEGEPPQRVVEHIEETAALLLPAAAVAEAVAASWPQVRAAAQRFGAAHDPMPAVAAAGAALKTQAESNVTERAHSMAVDKNGAVSRARVAEAAFAETHRGDVPLAEKYPARRGMTSGTVLTQNTEARHEDPALVRTGAAIASVTALLAQGAAVPSQQTAAPTSPSRTSQEATPAVLPGGTKATPLQGMASPSPAHGFAMDGAATGVAAPVEAGGLVETPAPETGFAVLARHDRIHHTIAEEIESATAAHAQPAVHGFESPAGHGDGESAAQSGEGAATFEREEAIMHTAHGAGEEDGRVLELPGNGESAEENTGYAKIARWDALHREVAEEREEAVAAQTHPVMHAEASRFHHEAEEAHQPARHLPGAHPSYRDEMEHARAYDLPRGTEPSFRAQVEFSAATLHAAPEPKISTSSPGYTAGGGGGGAVETAVLHPSPGSNLLDVKVLSPQGMTPPEPHSLAEHVAGHLVLHAALEGLIHSAAGHEAYVPVAGDGTRALPTLGHIMAAAERDAPELRETAQATLNAFAERLESELRPGTETQAQTPSLVDQGAGGLQPLMRVTELQEQLGAFVKDGTLSKESVVPSLVMMTSMAKEDSVLEGVMHDTGLLKLIARLAAPEHPPKAGADVKAGHVLYAALEPHKGGDDSLTPL